MESDEVAAEENGGKGPEEQPAKVEAAPADSTAVVKMEESKTSDGLSDREKRKQEVEKKLQVLKEKKHNLVQILKLILNAEEEFKRRNAQSAGLRPSVPLQVENPVDMGSVTRHVPKLSVEVNFGGDSGAESDANANPNSHGRQVHHLHSTSPSAGPFARPSHQNATTPRTSLVATGHGTPSNILNASGVATATSSPSRFAPTGHHGHHQSSSLPPVSAPGAQFAASSPSPAASGGASSAFKDSRLTNSS
ncbi:Uncharacterized protein M6B38_235725 [Iris pallida]|uniref:Uncharacterized protein n=1 Tax=Iris pallida TaxID=29817 RepID=A0AAX6DNQ2_IRIPA|nr:Uncharacterized protein M6B38_235725 [Iris pallida]